jgi:hypothetical protein
MVALTILLVAPTRLLQAQSLNYNPYALTTIAGRASVGNEDGTNRAARFNHPQGAVADASGNIDVADAGNCPIRRITAKSAN